jgi:Uma2 family endonuclease
MMSPSYNYSYAKAKLIGALLKLENFTVFSELTLRIDDKNHTPDVCLYPKREVDLSLPDTSEIAEMPSLAIEILSHTQTIEDILERFALYFHATVKSCWLVCPVGGAIVVYALPEKARRFSTGDIIDEQLDIRVPLGDIFD